MATETSSTTGGGIGFVGLLTIAFIVLKLVGVITWSWLWVLSPLWITALAVLGVLFIVGIVFLVIRQSGKRRDARIREMRKRHNRGT